MASTLFAQVATERSIQRSSLTHTKGGLLLPTPLQGTHSNTHVTSRDSSRSLVPFIHIRHLPPPSNPSGFNKNLNITSHHLLRSNNHHHFDALFSLRSLIVITPILLHDSSFNNRPLLFLPTTPSSPLTNRSRRQLNSGSSWNYLSPPLEIFGRFSFSVWTIYDPFSIHRKFSLPVFHFLPCQMLC